MKAIESRGASRYGQGTRVTSGIMRPLNFSKLSVQALEDPSVSSVVLQESAKVRVNHPPGVWGFGLQG